MPFQKNLNILRTKRDKLVKQKAFCGEGNRLWLECLKNAVRSLLLNGEDKFLNKLVNIHVLYLHCGRGFNFSHGRQMNRCLVSYFLCGNLQNNFSPHKCRKIWAWRLWNGRPLRGWAWLLLVLHVFRCIIFLLVAVRIHYDFSYLVLIQQMSPFHTWNLTLHWEKL